MGGRVSVEEMKDEYKELRQPIAKLKHTRKNRSVERRVNIEDTILNKKFKIPKAKYHRNSSYISSQKRSVILNPKETIYRKIEFCKPINKFFTKFFNKRNELKRSFNDSDLNFSDLECLKYSLDETEVSTYENSLNRAIKRNTFYSFNASLSEITKVESSINPHENILPLSQNISQPQISTQNKIKSDNKDLNKHCFSDKDIYSRYFYDRDLEPDQKLSSLRNNYYTKLVVKNILPMKKLEPISKNNIFIFDWDDTLLCTNYFSPSGTCKKIPDLKPNEKKFLLELEDLVLEILNFALKRGHIYIITNAMQGWVEFSAKIYYPRVAKLLKNVLVISARKEFEYLYPNDNKLWKTFTFLNISKEFNTKAITNLICIGDSMMEIEASQALFTTFKYCFLKSIKFRENPRPEELIKELKLVKDKLDLIFSSVKNLTINVEKRQKEKKIVTSEVKS